MRIKSFEFSLVVLAVLSACESSKSVGSIGRPAGGAVQPTSEVQTGIGGSAPSDDTVVSLAEAAHVTCQPGASNSLKCSTGSLEVELNRNCGQGGFFGAVVNEEGVVLREMPAAPASGDVARLGDGQFVCIQSTARKEQNPNWYFVRAIPVSSVAECKDNALCQMYGDRPVDWIRQPSGVACVATEVGDYVGDCPSGWVSAGSIEAFSEGL